MDQELISFVLEYLGVPDVGDTPQNKGQCVGLIEVWLDQHKRPHIWGNAADLLANADRSRYKVSYNQPLNYPPPGAVVCWGDSWGNGAGHTAIVLAANDLRIVVFEQNNPEGSSPVVATHTYAGIVGWITFS